MICQNCKKTIETPDFGDGVLDYSDVYEYRGFSFHEACFDEGMEKVDAKRKEVMEVSEASTKSRRTGEFINNPNAKIAGDGLPIVKVKEPRILKDYESGKL